MKIAMVGLRGLADGLGGVEKVVRELSTRLVEQGADVTCYCKARYSSEVEHKGVKLINLPTIYSKHLETAIYAFLATFRAARSDCDIVHIHALASAIFAWIPRLYGKRVVISVHGLDWQRAKWGRLARMLLRFGEWCTVRQAHLITCVSLSLQIYFRMRYPKCAAAYIPNGCDRVSKTPPPHKDYAPKSYFLYMGRLVPEKGIHRLIDAYSQLDTDKQLLIAGPQSHAVSYVERLKKEASNNSQIHFIGAITGETKEQILSHAYAFVLPSDIEGLPIAVLEASSRKVCPIVSSIPTSLELLGERTLLRGFVFDPESSVQLREALRASLDSPELTATLGEVACNYVSANYNWDNIATQLHEAYSLCMRKEGA